jgi:competence CoiA-like predicted nuclease
MLVAKNTINNEIVYSYEYDTEELRKLSKEKVLVCQECNNPVILRSGKVKVTHFAHNKCQCTYAYWENESEAHMKAKIEIKAKLESLYPDSKVYLEYRVDETQQRSDIMLIHADGRKWAFEIQLSRIPIDQLIERRKLYLKANVLDFWLMGYEYSWSTDYTAWHEISSFRTILNKLAFDGGITINDIPLDLITLVKKEKAYRIFDLNLLNMASNSYQKAKEAIYNALKIRYYNAKVTKDTLIGNTTEKADILLESKNGTKFAINLLYKKHHDILPEQSITEYKFFRNTQYTKSGVQVFWISGIYNYNSHEYYFIRDLGFDYFILNLENSYLIEAYYGNGYSNKFLIKDLVLSKTFIGSSYLLEDINLVNKLSRYKHDGYIIYDEKCPECRETLRLKRSYSNPILYCNCGYTKDTEGVYCPDCRYPMKLLYSKATYTHYWKCTNYSNCFTRVDARIEHKTSNV